jgi:DNA-binding NarL/FixJ family response regulator
MAAVGAARIGRRPGREEVLPLMVRVLVIADHAVALAPVRRALAAFPDARLVTDDQTGQGDVDVVVLDQSLGTSTTVDRLSTLAAAHPDALMVAIALQGRGRYRWIRMRLQEAGYGVRAAGTDRLSDIFGAIVGTADGDGASAHGAPPAIPRSTA